jgi:two-component system chemotaxis sensor kinase CheA
MIRRVSIHRGQWLQIAVAVLFASVLTLLLVLGMRSASELRSLSTALQMASELSARPQLMRSELTLIQHGLETQTYVGQSLRNLAAMRESSDQSYALLQNNLKLAGLDADTSISTPLDTVLQRWQGLDRRLTVLATIRDTGLYTDTASGSELSPTGRELKTAVDDLLVHESDNMQSISSNLAQLGLALRTAVGDSARGLRSLLLGGTAIAALLLGLMLYFAWRARQSAAAASDAQRQVANILGTVREGLFLIGRDLKLGGTCSDSLTELLRIAAPAGQSFEAVLSCLVDEKTSRAALKFLGLLWRDRVHEELIESINPLNQIEVTFPASHGSETRFLAFSFRRVRGADTSGDYILGVVADITDRVLLARELEHVKADSDSQAALLLQLLNVDGGQLQSLLGNADVAFRKSNALLTAPGKEQEDLKTKLHGVFRELHAIKGEAAALGLTSLVQRIHAAEDDLSMLRGKAQLSGSDFMPVVVKLDELMSHAANMQAMRARVAALRPGITSAGTAPESESDAHSDTIVIPQASADLPVPVATASLESMLRTLTDDVAASQARSVRFVTRGLEQVPAQYAGVIKDICIQMIRNSIVHGIEDTAQRTALGKPAPGMLRISFADDNSEDYLLTVEDDGRGLDYQQIMNKALRVGLMRPQQAASIERTAIYKLIFQPGFSTAETVSEHAGRGVGLDAVGSLVREHGGKIGVATAPGQYTRFKVLLPKASALPLNSSVA